MTKLFARALILVCVVVSADARADELPADAGAHDLPGGQCLECHLATEDEVGELWQDDVHARAEIGCDACHGGDPTQDDSDLAKRSGTGYRGELSALEITESCGGCHGNVDYMRARKPLLPVDQLEKYWTSGHGKLLVKGEPRVAQCASCHGAHGVREVNDAKSPVYASNVPATCGGCHGDADYMSDFDIKTNQYDEYVQSVHGKALLEKNDVRGAPACNDCHGNHGAAPPSIDAISNICGTCHSYNAELFLGSPLAPAFKEKSLADCVACHGKHLIRHVAEEWEGEKPGSTCRKCHEEGEEGSDLALYFTETFGSVRLAFDDIEQLLLEVEVKGMDVTEGEDYVEAARQGLMQARTLMHAFSKPVMEEKVSEISANQAAALEVGYAARRGLEDRRRGLGISTLLLLLLTLAVAIKIRTLPPFD